MALNQFPALRLWFSAAIVNPLWMLIGSKEDVAQGHPTVRYYVPNLASFRANQSIPPEVAQFNGRPSAFGLAGMKWLARGRGERGVWQFNGTTPQAPLVIEIDATPAQTNAYVQLPFTVVAAVKTPSVLGTDRHPIFASGGLGGGAELFIDEATSQWALWNGTIALSGIVAEPDKWYAVAAVFDGTRSLIQVEGVVANVDPGESALLSGRTATIALIGEDLDAPRNYWTDGQIGEIGVFDRRIELPERNAILRTLELDWAIPF